MRQRVELVHDSFAQWVLLLAAAIAVAILAGCAAKPYQLGSRTAYKSSPELEAVTLQQVERGTPCKWIDGLGWACGIPSKIILWDRRVENHSISEGTEEAVCEYLAANDLRSVKVRLNQYDPKDEWRRLVANKSVGWGWRYTAGVLSWLGYTILPGRVFGGDNFNPFTNTISLYSDVPAIALHEAGHAKDYAQRTWKGTYAVGYALVPGVNLWQEAIATNDAMGYMQVTGAVDRQREGYEILYPAYGTYVGDAIGSWVPPFGLVAYAAGAVGGHVIGRYKAKDLKSPPPPATTTVPAADRPLPNVELLPPVE